MKISPEHMEQMSMETAKKDVREAFHTSGGAVPLCKAPSARFVRALTACAVVSVTPRQDSKGLIVSQNLSSLQHRQEVSGS